MPTLASAVCKATFGFALVVYRLGPMQQCEVRCDGTCSGYGDLNDTHCAVCTIDPRESPVMTGTELATATFVEWNPQTKNHKGCQSNDQCLACPQATNITVKSRTHVMLSTTCTHYNPHESATDFSVHLNVIPGASDVKISGQGTITSNVWPLELNPPLRIGTKLTSKERNEITVPEVMFSLPESITERSAVQITESGKVHVSAFAPQFKTLVVVAGMHARPLRLHSSSYVEGFAMEALVGFGHVTGHIEIACLNTSTTQHYVVQEVVQDKIKVTQNPHAPCTEINLTRLLGFYGTAYEQRYFDDEGVDDPPWREVRYAATIAGLLLLVLFLGNQPTFSSKKTN